MSFKINPAFLRRACANAVYFLAIAVHFVIFVLLQLPKFYRKKKQQK
jgi:hypothetical protein